MSGLTAFVAGVEGLSVSGALTEEKGVVFLDT